MQPIHRNPPDLRLLDQEFELFRESIISYPSDLRDYHQVVEELLDEAEAKHADRVLASAEHLEEPRRSKMLAMYVPYWSLTFAPQFRASFVVWAVSVLELHLEWASRLAGGFAQIPLTGADLRERTTVDQYKKFFSRLAGFEAPANDAWSWSRLRKLYTIRNALAHSGAYVMFEPKGGRMENLKKAIGKFRGITLDEHEVMLKIDTTFCEDVIDLVRAFCSYLLAQLPRAREAFLRRNPGHTV